MGVYAPEKRREKRVAVKISLNQMKVITTRLFLLSSYKGGRMLNLGSPLCLVLGSSCGGGE